MDATRRKNNGWSRSQNEGPIKVRNKFIPYLSLRHPSTLAALVSSELGHESKDIGLRRLATPSIITTMALELFSKNLMAMASKSYKKILGNELNQLGKLSALRKGERWPRT